MAICDYDGEAKGKFNSWACIDIYIYIYESAIYLTKSYLILFLFGNLIQLGLDHTQIFDIVLLL